MATLAHEGAGCAVVATPRAANLAQAAGAVALVAVLGIGALLIGTPARDIEAAASIATGGLGLGQVGAGVPLSDQVRGGRLLPVTPVVTVGCAAGIVAAKRVNGFGLLPVGVGDGVRGGWLWRTGRMQEAPGASSGLLATIGGGELRPGMCAAALPMSAAVYVAMTEGGGGAETAINLPAYWLAVPLPADYIGEVLAAAAIARGEAVVCSLGDGVTIGGRELINNTGAQRVYAAEATFEAWRSKVLADLAAQVGGLAVRGCDAAGRSAWVKAMRESNAGKAQALLRQSLRVSDDSKRAALVADAEFLLARV